MASKARSCFDVISLLKSSYYPVAPRSLTGSPLIRCRYLTDGLKLEKLSPLLCASLHSLPGNRFQTFTRKNVLTLPSNSRSESTRVQDATVSWSLGSVGIEELKDFTPLNDKDLQKGVAQNINTCMELGEHGRLYAVVHVRSLQYKVTPGDIIIVKHDFPPDVGDKIRLEKVLAVGGADFTLFGQPLLSRSQVLVEATVIEKTLSHNRIWFVYRKRKNFKRFHVYRERQTMLVINSVKVIKSVDTDQEPSQQIESKEEDLPS